MVISTSLFSRQSHFPTYAGSWLMTPEFFKDQATDDCYNRLKLLTGETQCSS